MFKDHFSAAARSYARFRPEYPDGLFHWLAETASARERAWDAATGTGQAALGLANHFTEVIATDASAEQIRHARPHARIRYEVAPAEYVPIENNSIDLVLVAQALHWFEFDAFFGEVRRVCRAGGILAAVSYGLFRCEPSLDALIDNFYQQVLDGFWPMERRYIDEEYRTIPFPFEEIEAPRFEMRARWTLDHLLGYLGTWSAVSRAREASGVDPLRALEPDLRRLWGEPLEFRSVVWPLNIRAGRS
ncbi:MAG: SAM-dependent methyltransferase [Gammaproteobacteria bacterium SG8_31]|nr:MAG: SAM-dependent methyltransferase [Gammaproteobacteria bacterium SG8_31]